MSPRLAIPGIVRRFSDPVANVSSRLKSLTPSGAWFWVRSSGPFSRTTTWCPALTNVEVSGAPPAPLPITTTSISSSATLSPSVVGIVTQRCLQGSAPVEQCLALPVGESALQIAPPGGARIAAGLRVDECTSHRMPPEQ